MHTYAYWLVYNKDWIGPSNKNWMVWINGKPYSALLDNVTCRLWNRNAVLNVSMKCIESTVFSPIWFLGLGRICLNNTFDHLTFHHVSTDGGSGFRILNVCVMVLCVVSVVCWFGGHGLFYGCIIVVSGLYAWPHILSFAFVFIFSEHFPVTTPRRVPISGAYINQYTVSLVPSD